MTRFEGFGPGVGEWFLGLEEDNSREYFSALRAFFDESVRGQMAALLTELSDTFGGEVKMFRPNRDIRFSADSRRTRPTPTVSCSAPAPPSTACTRRSRPTAWWPAAATAQTTHGSNCCAASD